MTSDSGSAGDQSAGHDTPPESAVTPQSGEPGAGEPSLREGVDRSEPLESAGSEPSAHVAIDVGLLRAAAGRWESALEMTLRSSVIPYGYTVTIWSSGGYLISLRGAPDFFEAFGFVAGALFAFAVLASLSSRLPAGSASATTPAGPEPGHPIFGAGLHIVAVGLALGTAAALDRFTGQWAWLFASFAATTIYLAAAGGELAIATEVSRRELRLRAPKRMRRGKRVDEPPGSRLD